MALALPRIERLEKTFLLFAALTALVWLVGRPLPGAGLLQLALYVTGLLVALKLLRRATRTILWRVRNRMIIVFLFVGFVPLLLATSLVVLAGYVLIGQVAVHIATAELERQEARLQGLANGIAWATDRPEGARAFLERAAANWPGLQVWTRSNPDQMEPPRPELKGVRGIVRRQGRFFLMAYASSRGEAAVLQPLTEPYLSSLEPQLGRLSLYSRSRQAPLAAASRTNLTAPTHRFDYEVIWGTAPFAVPGWTDADRNTEQLQLRIETRPAAVYRRLFGQGAELAEGVTGAFLVLGIVFLVVELGSLVTSISITRTVTSSVHELYEGTQKVNQGDFSYRIPPTGHDQLAELGRSFNSMTESIERLIEESKERERLASELAIAREVQAQLFPKAPPELRTLEILGVCHAASMVSGDYYDFVHLPDDRLALAIADVAGKGISGALLMASIQSMLRTQLSIEASRSGRDSEHGVWHFPTAHLVSQLNLQLYQNTPPEKYATFFFGAYDDRHGLLTYTNAGHLPPILIRDGEAQRLAVNGLVIGAFPFATYEQSQIELYPGDLLVAFTDGASEPENEFVEEFGEPRLIELLPRHRHRSPREIMDEVIRAVTGWTGRPELQDDLTLMIARRR